MKDDVLGVQFGSYVAEEVLNTGHLTQVLRASHVNLDRKVVLKILKTSLDAHSSFAQSLEREAGIIAKFNHQNIPRLLQFYRDDERVWMAMDWNDGFTLRQIVDAQTRPHIGSAVAIAVQLASALVHVHEHGIVHGDVQPSNVLVTTDGRVSLIDFGRARVIAEQDSLPTEELVGRSSDPYMSPEHVLGGSLDERSDMFSFAVLVYELVALRRPFESSEQRTVSAAIRHDIPVSVSHFVDGVPKQLSQLIATCLNKAPADRYPSMRRVLSALRTIQASLPERGARDAIVRSLVHSRLLSRPPSISEEEDSSDAIVEVPSYPSLLPALRLMLALLAVASVGAVAIHWAFRNEFAAQAAAKRGPLRLVPATPGYLRVMARPWAHVLVDGQQVETTPFFKPISLDPGLHYVTLRHPNAPDERRVLSLAPGELVTLDVTMQVKAPSPSASSSAAPAMSGGTGDAGAKRD